jgi:hypothetical protein
MSKNRRHPPTPPLRALPFTGRPPLPPELEALKAELMEETARLNLAGVQALLVLIRMLASVPEYQR